MAKETFRAAKRSTRPNGQRKSGGRKKVNHAAAKKKRQHQSTTRVPKRGPAAADEDKIEADAATGGVGAASTAAPVPKSMVFRRGPVTASVVQLVRDMRLLMSPNSSTRLQERKSNSLKDFVSVAPLLGVSHFQVFTQTDLGVNLRLARVPHGPTLTFRITAFSLMADIVKIQKRPHSPSTEYDYAPLVVLNNFNAQPIIIDPLQGGGDDDAAAANVSASASTTYSTVHAPTSDHIKLVATVLRTMYPPLSVPTLKLPQCRRVVLYHFDPVSHLIDMRHYLIRATPANISRAVKKLLKSRIPNLGHLNDVSEYMSRQNQATLSDSEGEDTPDSHVTLADQYAGRGNFRNQQSAVRLQELGPRLTMSLMKVEEEFFTGRVLYHHYVKKTKEEEELMQQMKRERERERERRRKEQEENVRKKLAERNQVTSKRTAADIDADASDDADVEEDDADDRKRAAYDPDMQSDGGNDADDDDDDDDDRVAGSRAARRGAPTTTNAATSASRKRSRAAASSSSSTASSSAVDATSEFAAGDIDAGGGDEDEDDDAAWYEREVGEKPDPTLFAKSARRSRDGAGANAAADRSKRFKRADREGKNDDHDGDGDNDAKKKSRSSGGRRVGAGPRKPWVRGRGGKFAASGRGGGRGGSSRGGGSSSRGSSRGRGGARGRGGRGGRR